MSLINHIEIIEQNETKLQSYLLSELKRSANWRENKADMIEDQCKYYQTYFGKKYESNMHINKDIISHLLHESEEYNKNDTVIPQTNFIDITLPDDSLEKFDLLFYDALTNYFKVITIQDDEKKIELNNLNETKVITDTKVIDMKVNQSSQIINLLDMYSLYHLDIIDNNDDKNIIYKKMLTLEEIPNCFMSQQMIDRFFIISQGNNSNWIHLIDTNYNILTKKILNNNNTLQSSAESASCFKKGEFLGIGENIGIYNKNTILLCDFRSPQPRESILFYNESFNIHEMKYIDNFNYVTYSPQKLSLFDLRYPSLQISESFLHINYSSLKCKEILTSETQQFPLKTYSCFDDSKRDQSHLMFTMNESKTNVLDSFCQFDLIKNDTLNIDIHDMITYINNKGLYLNFIVDNLSGLYLNVYDINKNKNRDITEVIASFKKGSFINATYNEQIKAKSLDDDVVKLYRKIYFEQVYKKKKHKTIEDKKKEYDYKGKCGKIEEDELEDNDNSDNLDFGTVIINGEKKKMYRIENKRHLLKDTLNHEDFEDDNNDVEMKDNSKDDDDHIDKLELNQSDIDKLNFLIDDFNISAKK